MGQGGKRQKVRGKRVWCGACRRGTRRWRRLRRTAITASSEIRGGRLNGTSRAGTNLSPPSSTSYQAVDKSASAKADEQGPVHAEGVAAPIVQIKARDELLPAAYARTPQGAARKRSGPVHAVQRHAEMRDLSSASYLLPLTSHRTHRHNEIDPTASAGITALIHRPAPLSTVEADANDRSLRVGGGVEQEGIPGIGDESK
jgi:hypothetical protein